MAEYREAAERRAEGSTTRVETWAHIVAGAAAVGVLLGLLWAR